MYQKPELFKRYLRGWIMTLVLLAGYSLTAQTLLWSDEFNGNQLDESIWNYALGDGCSLNLCGWGNQELQTYTRENVSVANGKLVITARRENRDGKEFTSARLLTKDKVSVKYGRVEASIKLPNMDDGLWPAFWMLGDGNRWPYTGEIDIMEAGFSARTTNANAVAKANVFWRAEDAGVTGNLQYGNEDAFKYDAPAASGKYLNEAYFVYRADWTPTSLKTYVLQTDASGNPIESSAYEIFSIENSATFQSEFFSGDNFYLLINLAVGGWLPFTSAENVSANVTALPNAGSEGYMLVDYVRVYSLNGNGAVTLGNVEEEVLGTNGFGIFADGTATDAALDFGVDAEVFLWEDGAAPAIELSTVSSPYGKEGYEITFPANQWAGMTLNSSDVLNLDNYRSGSLRFMMKTTSQQPFRIAVESAGGSAGINFLAGEEKYGLLRDGQWHQVQIPLELIITHFERVYSPFVISNVENNNPATTATYQIDEIHFSSLPALGFSKYVPATGNYGLYTSSPVADELTLGTEGDIFVWEQTLIEGPAQTYNGQTALSYVNNAKGWFGLGFTADELHDMSAFEGGSLHLAMKSTGTETLNLTVNIGLAAGTVVFQSGNDPYGFARDGQWHELSIPLEDFSGVNLSGVKTLLSISGAGNIANLSLADIYFEYNPINQPVLTSISVSPATATIDEGATQQFTAQGFDQNGLPMPASFNWSVNGGTISNTGLYTGSAIGSFTITASSGSIQGNAAITVNPVFTGIALPATLQAEDFETYYDFTAGNTGGAYRSTDVDIEATGDTGGGYNVGWIDAGEWLEYSVSVATAGNFDFTARLASPSGASSMHVSIDGGNVTGAMIPVATGSWQSFADVKATNIPLTAGNHTLRITFDGGGINLNYLSVTTSQLNQPVLTSIVVSPANPTINVGATQQFSAQGYDQFGAPIATAISWSVSGGQINGSGLYTGNTAGSYVVTASSGSITGTAGITVNSVATGWAIPGRIEAENFNSGGQNVGYFDTSAGNNGGAFRTTEDVDIENAGDSEGLYNVGWAEAGEWLAYDLNVTGSNFNLDLRVASAYGGGSLKIEIDGQDVTGIVSVAATGGWQSYQTISLENIGISSGNHQMKIVFVSSGLNLNYVEFSTSTTSGGCGATGPNGDYSVSISEDNSNPTLTFVPGYNGVGNNLVLLYYGTSATGPYPGYLVSPNTPFQITAANGQTVHYYYTYSVPEGGERNSSANPHSFVVGNCAGTSSRVSTENAESFESFQISIYPNPASNLLNVSVMGEYSELILMDVSGKVLSTYPVSTQTTVDISMLKKGYYLLGFKSQSGIQIRRFIKQ